MKTGVLPLLLIVSQIGMITACDREKEERMSCNVTKVAEPPTIDANWEKSPWQSIEPLSIGRYRGEKPEHCPKTQVKIAYDDAAIYVIFRVEDRYVRAVAPEHDGKIWCDSCVEFFFTPGRDVDRGYFNLEMNCGGTMLLHFQKEPRKNSIHIPLSKIRKIQIAHTLPKIVDPEIEKPVTWTVEYRLPIAILEQYCRVDRPAPGTVWRANFYKCGEDTSHPHWLTWSPIEIHDFHRPEEFGVMQFQSPQK